MGLDDSRSSYDASTKGGTDAVPNIPSTQPFNHNAIILMDSIDEALSKRRILAVCKGEASPRASNFIDMPIGRLSIPDVTDPGYASAMRTFLQWETTNAINQRKRFQYTLEDWTLAYNLLAKA